MARVNLALGTIALLACGVLGLPTVHAQATVETGGVTGAASNVTTITRDFSGMAGTITGTATDSPDAVPAQSATPAQVAAPDPPPALEAPVPADMPDTAGDD